VNFLSSPGAALILLLHLGRSHNTLRELVQSLDRHKNREVVEETGRGRVTSGSQVDMVGSNIRESLFGVKGLSLFALESTIFRVRVTGDMMATSVGVVSPERKFLAAVHGRILDRILREERNQRIEILVVDTGLATKVMLGPLVSVLPVVGGGEHTLTETENAWIRLIMDFFSMMTLSLASLGRGVGDFAERSVGTWIQIRFAKLRL
jgi:hypothetical protein